MAPVRASDRRTAQSTEVRTRVTDEEGRFTFEEVTPGPWVVVSSAMGYRSEVDTLTIEADTQIRMAIRLSPSPLELEPLVVVTPRRMAFMAGFEQRRAEGRTNRGFFLPEDFQKWNARYVSDMFRLVPGWDLVPPRPGRGGAAVSCSPDVWVNGRLYGPMPMAGAVGGRPAGDTEMDPTWFDHFFPPEQVAAVEVYPNQHEVPSQFAGPGTCGAVVLWLRDRGPDRRLAAWWKRTLVGFGALVGLILLTR